jgi:hypothetical protein
MRAPHMQRAARRDPDGSPGKFDHFWRAIKREVSRERAAEQITSAPPIDHPLPCVREAYMRDRAARIALDPPLVDHDASRRDYAAAIAADEFCAARRRGRGRR